MTTPRGYNDVEKAMLEAAGAQLMRARRRYRENVLHPVLREFFRDRVGIDLSMVDVAKLAEQLEREGHWLFDKENETVMRMMQADNGIDPCH